MPLPANLHTWRTCRQAACPVCDIEMRAMVRVQVWVVGELQEDGLLKWQADSDSQLTKVSYHHTSKTFGSLSQYALHTHAHVIHRFSN